MQIIHSPTIPSLRNSPVSFRKESELIELEKAFDKVPEAEPERTAKIERSPEELRQLQVEAARAKAKKMLADTKAVFARFEIRADFSQFGWEIEGDLANVLNNTCAVVFDHRKKQFVLAISGIASLSLVQGRGMVQRMEKILVLLRDLFNVGAPARIN